MGSANNSAGFVHETGTVFQQGTGTQRSCLAGHAPNVKYQFLRKGSQSKTKCHGLDRKYIDMSPAAVAGAPLFADNEFPVTLTDIIAKLIDFSDQLLIILERLQWQIPLFAVFDKTRPFILKLVRYAHNWNDGLMTPHRPD